MTESKYKRRLRTFLYIKPGDGPVRAAAIKIFNDCSVVTSLRQRSSGELAVSSLYWRNMSEGLKKKKKKETLLS